MTTRREIPIGGDTGAWVHNEIAELKSKLSVVQQVAEQSRNLATEAAEQAGQSRAQVELVDAQLGTMQHAQEDLRVLRDLLSRSQDDIHSLRQSREELERRILADAERYRGDRNEAAHRVGELERQIESWGEQLAAAEEHNRRNLEMSAQLGMRMDGFEASQTDVAGLSARTQTAFARIDQELQRLTAAASSQQRADDEQRERVNSVFEVLRRLESETEVMRAETNRISRIDDRLELVQAERTRHNEHLNEIMATLNKIEVRLVQHDDHNTLIEARIAGYQDEVRSLNGKLQASADQVAAYLHSLNELEADMRKRQIIALEKEIRDVRSRAFNVSDE